MYDNRTDEQVDKIRDFFDGAPSHLMTANGWDALDNLMSDEFGFEWFDRVVKQWDEFTTDNTAPLIIECLFEGYPYTITVDFTDEDHPTTFWASIARIVNGNHLPR